MKKIFTCICALMLCVGLVSCKKADGNAAAAAGTKHKIGILAPAVTHGWVAAVAYFAEQRCKQLSDIDYKILTSQSAEQMTQQLDDLEAWGAEAIVTFPQWQGMEAPFAAAIKRGIKVVSFDIEGEGLHVFHHDITGPHGPDLRLRLRTPPQRLHGHREADRPQPQAHRTRHQIHP